MRSSQMVYGVSGKGRQAMRGKTICQAAVASSRLLLALPECYLLTWTGCVKHWKTPEVVKRCMEVLSRWRELFAAHCRCKAECFWPEAAATSATLVCLNAASVCGNNRMCFEKSFVMTLAAKCVVL